jgi:tryptophan 2,3-dioxygenase
VLTALSADDRTYEPVTHWLTSYITRSHAELGRRGPVCPFVGQALAAGAITLAAYRFGSGERTVHGMSLAIEEAMARFEELVADRDDPNLLSLIMTFPDLGADDWHLVDDGHLASKTAAVAKGLMLGQFHPLCDAPGAHNETFPVNRAPIPLMVIRAMSPHDILFLEENAVWVDHYTAMMASRGIPLEHPASRVQRLRDRKSRSANGAVATQPPSACPVGPGRPGGGAPYVRYADLDQLHDMQSPASGTSLELSFVLITQVKELLFRMLYVELDTARTQIRKGDVAEVCRALQRANRVQHVLLVSWETLTGMSATDFAGFREILGEASGQQSYMYRALEFIMGNKDAGSLANLRKYGELHHLLEREVSAPSLYDEVVAYLDRNVRPLGDELRARDVSAQHVANEDVEAAWLDIYREPRKHPDGYLLAEALIELSYRFSQWRATHLLVVERMIGFKPGTGGTEGVEWLRHINEHRFFQELWTVRTKI